MEQEMPAVRWGVCVDIKLYGAGIYQQAVLYEIQEDGSALILLPERAAGSICSNGKEEILMLSAPPKYIYGQWVFPVNHPERRGIVFGIGWHFKKACCFYAVAVGGKILKKRYFDSDLALADNGNEKKY